MILLFICIILVELYNIPKKLVYLKSNNFNSYSFLSNKESILYVDTKDYIKENEDWRMSLEDFRKNCKWEIEIPVINLVASINEGVGSDILDNYVGHFEDTGIMSGNIGLAAHNRGYKNNYFSRIKELKKGDMIYYTFYGENKSFVVSNLYIIEDDNWDLLSNNFSTMLTLITCLEDRPHFRRCIQAVEM